MSGENTTQCVNTTFTYFIKVFTTEDLVNQTIYLVNDTMKMNTTLAFAQSQGTNQTMQDAVQSAQPTGEVIQRNASDLRFNIPEGAKNLATNIAKDYKI
jgi:hypothetical protein